MNYIYCESCKDYTEHDLIKEDKHLYKCKECGDVEQYVPEKKIPVRAVISSGDESEPGSVSLTPSELVGLKDELVVELEEGFKIGEITSVELKSGKRVDEAEVKNIETLWLKDVGEMPLRISLNHVKGETIPVTFNTPGDTEFYVGEELDIDNITGTITKIMLENGKILDRSQQSARTRDIKRVYAESKKKRGKRWRKKGKG